MADSRAVTLLIVFFVAALPLSNAQVFRVQGGTSTLLNAQGGSLEVKAPGYSGDIGVGFYNGSFQFGAVARSRINGYTVTAGDDSILFDLPTDWFDGTHYFLARGIGIAHAGENSTLRVFAGNSSSGFSTGFFHAAHADDPIAIMFYDRRLTPRLKFISRNVLSKSDSSLQGFAWRPEKWLDVSMTAGFGSKRLYSAAGFNIQTDKLALKAAYIQTGGSFRRVTLASPLASEVQKGNFEIVYQPNRIVTLNAGHHNILEPITPDAPFTPASVNEVGANFHVGRSYFGTGYFASTVQSRATKGTNLYVGRRITSNIDVTANYFTSQSQGGTKSDILSGTVRETLSKRIGLSQLITRSNGQTTAAIGGDLLTNRFKFRADYQNVYLPYRPDRPFQQALALNVAMRISGPLQITGGTNVAPDGRLRYSLGISTYLYRERGMWRSSDSESFSFPKYAIVGVVRDTAGNPLEGAAIHIGNQVVYSNETGEFLLRFRKRSGVPFRVEVSEFLIPGSFEVVRAPSSVIPEVEENGEKIEVVVRRQATRGQ